MKKLFAIGLVLASMNVQAHNRYECSYYADKKFIKVDLDLYDAIENKKDKMVWNGQEYILDNFDKFAKLFVVFSNPYKAQDGSITQAGTGMESGTRYFLIRDFNTKEYSYIKELNCDHIRNQ